MKIKREAMCRSVTTLTLWVLFGVRFVLAQGTLPIAGFEVETTVDRLSLDLSVTDLDGEEGYMANMSGCCVMPSTGELLVIMNRGPGLTGPPAIQVYDREGVYLRHVGLTGFDDTEGLCQYDPDRDEFAIVEEAVNEITIVTITSATTNIVKAAGRTIATGIPVGADGLEGVTYDRAGDVFYVVQEVPMGVFRVTTNGGSVVSEELFDAGNVFDGICTDLSDLFYVPHSGHLFILSDEGNLLMECTLDGTILAALSVAGTQPEGIAVADSGTEFYICGEPNEYYRYAVAAPSDDAPEGTTVELPVVLNTAPTGSVSVGYTIASVAATPGDDFALPASGTLTFGPALLSATVTVSVLRDAAVEGIEVLEVTLTNAVNAELSGESRYELRIVNAVADAPILGNAPFDCEVTPDTTPSFSFQAIDPDGEAGMVYEIRWSTDPAFASGVTERGSASDAGFENASDGGDTSPFTEGHEVSFSVQPGDALSDTPADTVYYWQVRASDAAADQGSGVFGEWSATRSLAVDSGLSLSGWGQTTAEQFSGDTLEGTEVAVSDSVQLGQGLVTLDNAASGRAQPGATITISGFSVADMPSRLLLLGVASRDGVSVTSATFAGVPLTPLDSSLNGTSVGAHFWYLKNPPATADQVVVSLSAAGTAVAGVTSWYNVDQGTPFGTVAKATGQGLAASVDVASAAGSTVVDMMAFLAARDLVAGNGQSRRRHNAADAGGRPPVAVSGALSSKVASAPTNMSWSVDSSRARLWALVAVPLRNADSTVGSVVSPPIDFGWVPGGADWGEVTFTGDLSGGAVRCGVQYWNGAGWQDTSITNRDASPIDISGLDPAVHGSIRLMATLTRGTGSPQLMDWAVSWAKDTPLQITGIDLTPDGLRLLWSSTEDRRYAIYRSTNLLSPWPEQPITNGVLGDPSGTNGVTLPPLTASRAFYRIEVESI
jgi:uncharacterized protein YjiK